MSLAHKEIPAPESIKPVNRAGTVRPKHKSDDTAHLPALIQLASDGSETQQSLQSCFVNLDRAFAHGDSGLVGREYERQKLIVASLDPWHRQQYFKFNQIFTEVASKQHNALGSKSAALNIIGRFLDALPHYPPDTDLSFLPRVADYYFERPQDFSGFIDAHRKFASSAAYNHYAVAARVLIKTGFQNSESPLSIVKALNQLFESPIVSRLAENPDLAGFFRGLIQNDWPIASSVSILKDALERQTNFASALRLSALSAQKGKAENSGRFVDPDCRILPPALEFLSLGAAQTSELDLAINLYSETKAELTEVNRVACQLFALIEACRFSPQVKLENVAKRIRREMQHDRNPLGIIQVSLKNTLHSVDNMSARRLIEAMLNSSDAEQFSRYYSLLKDVHNADVPDTSVPSSSPRALFVKQVDIFNQALQFFDISRQVRIALSALSGELRYLPDFHPGLLASFGCHVGNVSNLQCTENQYPGSGVVLSKFSRDKLFMADPHHPESPLHRYLDTSGWTEGGIRDFLRSRIVITKSFLAVSVPGSLRYRLGADEFSVIFFADTEDNYGGNQCLLLPTAILDSEIKPAEFDIMELPGRAKGVLDLSTQAVYPEDLVLKCQRKGALVLDLGAATNIGGLSNASAVFGEPKLRGSADLDRLFGLNQLDPWGNVKKMSLLRYPALFSEHSSLHGRLADMMAGFGQVYSVFENRYAAWKRGNTPLEMGEDHAWLSNLPAEMQNLRILEAAYNWHVQLSAARAAAESFPRLNFWQIGSMQNGPFADFFLDIRSLQLHLTDETIQLPRLGRRQNVTDSEAMVRALLESAAQNWEIYVRPQLSDLMPVIDFSCKTL